ncbi:MAG: hypothetical protein QF541_17170 [Lentisphaeria bacterium]|nr:hypothetical protein [Lentisphaeria bacterium]
MKRLMLVWGYLLLALAAVAERPAVPRPFLFMYGHSDNDWVHEGIQRITPPFTGLEGTSANADVIKEFRARGVVYAAHVINPVTATKDELVATWRAPFDNDLGGDLPGGYEAIAIDEFRDNRDSTRQCDRVCRALKELRGLYPDKLIFVAATWQLGHHADQHTEQLNAINDYADVLMLEAYLREGNFAYRNHGAYADNLKAVVPALLNKTVLGLGISQDDRVAGGGHMFDDSPHRGFVGCLDYQLHSIRNDPDLAGLPGAMFWAYYRTHLDTTPEVLARLCDHYFVQGNTGYLGDGKWDQFIGNPIFDDGAAGWALVPGEGGAVELFNYRTAGVFPTRNRSSKFTGHGSHGLKMVRGATGNRVSYRCTGIDTGLVHIVSAFVMAKSGKDNRASVTVAGPDGAESATRELPGVRPGHWSRIAFTFVPATSTIDVVLSDEGAAVGTTLYWDFIELEDAYPVPVPPFP